MLFCKFTLYVSGVNHTHQLPPFNVAKLGHVGGRLHKKYDQYRRLYLQFCVLLMMGMVDTRNMNSELAE